MNRGRSIGVLVLVLHLVARVAAARPPASVGEPAPEIAAPAWLNSEPRTVGALRGRVVLVEFWTYGCQNCRNVEPYVKEWHRKYASRGLVVIGVHSPEFSHERDPANVERYVRERKIAYPVAIDGDFAVWDRYGNRAWPAFYLIDKKGIVRHTRVGEGAYAETEARIRELLAEE